VFYVHHLSFWHSQGAFFLSSGLFERNADSYPTAEVLTAPRLLLVYTDQNWWKGTENTLFCSEAVNSL